MSKEKQQELGLDIVPIGGVTAVERVIAFDDILPPENAPLPASSFVNNVEMWGILSNICVVPDTDDRHKWRVVIGRRRWRAVSLLREKSPELAQRFAEIAVDVYTNLPSVSTEHLITLIENYKRTKNPLADAESVRRLREGNQAKGEAGLSPDAITVLTGMSRPQQENALRLFKLIPELHGFLLADKLDVKLAMQIAKLPTKAEQKAVLKNYERRIAAAQKNGERTAQRIIREDYSKARQIVRAKEVSALPESLFAEEVSANPQSDSTFAAGLNQATVGRDSPLSFDDRARFMIDSLYPDSPSATIRKWLERGRELFNVEAALPAEPEVVTESAPLESPLERPDDSEVFV